MGENEALRRVALAAQVLLERGLGDSEGYIVSGKSGTQETRALQNALKDAGYELVYQRGTNFEVRA